MSNDTLPINRKNEFKYLMKYRWKALLIIGGIIFAIVKFKQKNNNNLDNIEDKSSVNINIKPNTQNI